MRLGSMIERGDATARLLDVKYYLLLPEGQEVGGALDRDQWTTILQIVSAKTAYRHLYREALKPWLVADMLIFRRELPRSLAWTAEETVGLLGEFGARSGRQGAGRPARPPAAVDSSRSSTSTPIFRGGLHEWLHAYIRDNNAIGAGDRRPVPVRPDAALRPARHHLHLCRAGRAASSSCCASTPLELRRPERARLADRRRSRRHVCARAATAMATSPTCSMSTSRCRSLSVSVNGRVLTEDRAGIVQGLPHDLPPQVFCRATPLTEAGPGDRRPRPLDSTAGPDPALGRLHNLNAPPLRDDALRHRGDRGRHQRRAGRRRRPWRLPGFRPYVHRRRARARHPGPLRLRPSVPPRRRPRPGGRRTPGPRPGSAISAGSPSIRPTAFRPTTPMSASPAGSTIATPRRSPAHVRVAAPRIWR